MEDIYRLDNLSDYQKYRVHEIFMDGIPVLLDETAKKKKSLELWITNPIRIARNYIHNPLVAEGELGIYRQQILTLADNSLMKQADAMGFFQVLLDLLRSKEPGMPKLRIAQYVIFFAHKLINHPKVENHEKSDIRIFLIRFKADFINKDDSIFPVRGPFMKMFGDFIKKA
ncbi:hypothetical protein MKQ70_32265 [Chitinophaga sedimenti]|uniref:hypothetical protein n=1 Tax=Chitinophaga sedimenti TaxID=2033606 RepID=UPI00200695D0|nr:hypothetical protein [Chitinophaga sedimenti]MCK7559393.1 hypothetical protein [Chitinophaga sedimenti]